MKSPHFISVYRLDFH